jgi:hypothetical protein
MASNSSRRRRTNARKARTFTSARLAISKARSTLEYASKSSSILRRRFSPSFWGNSRRNRTPAPCIFSTPPNPRSSKRPTPAIWIPITGVISSRGRSAGARVLFEPAGFNVIALPGRDWAFLAEFGPPRRVEADTLAEWLWRPVPENIDLIRKDRFGSLFETIGLESARCYFESAAAEARTRQAPAYQNERRPARWSRLNPFASGRKP